MPLHYRALVCNLLGLVRSNYFWTLDHRIIQYGNLLFKNRTLDITKSNIWYRYKVSLSWQFFTCAQPIVIGLFEQSCSMNARMQYPILYRASADSFSLRTFFFWIGNAVLHSMVLFWGSKAIYGDGIVWHHGKEGGYLVLGNFIYTVSQSFYSWQRVLEVESLIWILIYKIFSSTL